MAKELNEDSAIKISVKTLIGIAIGLSSLIGMWFSLQADIAEAKKLPVPPAPEVSRMEFDMKDELIRQTILNTQKEVTEIKKSVEKIEDKLLYDK